MTLTDKLITLIEDMPLTDRDKTHYQAIVSELVMKEVNPSPTEKREDSKGWGDWIEFASPPYEIKLDGKIIDDIDTLKSLISDLLKKQREEIVERIEKHIDPGIPCECSHTDITDYCGHIELFSIVDEIKQIEEETL